MRGASKRAGFTLVELLVSTAVLALIVVLTAQMTSATISAVSHTAHRLDGSEGVRTAVRMLRDELSGALANQSSNRYLNLMVRESEQSVELYFTVPQASTADLTRLGFVNHIVYIWDRQSRTFYRAEYHSSRREETVLATARSAESTDMSANLSRLKEITPAYRGNGPYDWIAEPFWEELLKEARRTPLLTGVNGWSVECLTDNVIGPEGAVRNAWKNARQLPVALRFTFTLDAQQRPVSAKGGRGRRYTSLIPLACAEPVQ